MGKAREELGSKQQQEEAVIIQYKADDPKKEELNSQYKDKRKDVVKKVIAAMTVGKDVSSLFTDVVNCMQTENLELKNLVYLYLINYAKSQPDLAILVVNTFVKDSQDPNPLIRDLVDDDPYVRKTIAICFAKIYDINDKLAEDGGFLDALKDLISDNNPMFVANIVADLAEMQESSSRSISKITSHTLSKLLTALNKCAKLTCQVHGGKLDPTLLDELFSNIATLSFVYNKPPKEFITRVKTTHKIEEEEYVDAGEQGYPDSPAPIAENDVLSPASTANARHPATRQPATPAALAFPDLLNLRLDNSNCAIVSTDQHATPADPPLPAVLLASSGQGLQISAQLVQRDGQVFYSMMFEKFL
ncbi:Beta-adaptin-like protein B [Capsicum annuum]|uniref:Beta-adaptin-like protein B n=1 Tax=Capsicum annuum TaxID=4072 RepID=A0A2G2YED6_CAPAN|nr:Beta-adaptin-like protein B [Capsicum annuum]PHT68110.1 Beta-adaptin-like protein B [Capsicum annuum]